MAKDKEARERMSIVGARVEKLERLSLTVAMCPKCEHRTIQERIYLRYSNEEGKYVEYPPFIAGDRVYQLIEGARCLVCGTVFRLMEITRVPVEMLYEQKDK